MKGKKICNALKQIRRQIAEANDIEYEVDECAYQGECQGTCPKCESEVRYLEHELLRRQSLGKSVILAGLATTLSVFGGLGCNSGVMHVQGDVAWSADSSTIAPSDTAKPEAQALPGTGRNDGKQENQ